MNHEREIFSRPRQTTRRKELRNNLTPAEAALWDLIKNRKLSGRKFRRQQGIGSYIVDFCCPAEYLVIELDGAVHNHPAQAAYDLVRDEEIRALGFKILRFENKDVFRNTEAVLDAIVGAFDCGVWAHPCPNGVHPGGPVSPWAARRPLPAPARLWDRHTGSRISVFFL